MNTDKPVQQSSEEWVSVKDRLPDDVGQYECMNGHGCFPAFFIRNTDGKKVWLAPNEQLKPTHWRPKT